MDSFRQAASSVPDPQTQAFLQRALHQVVSILLDQKCVISPSLCSIRRVLIPPGLLVV